MTQFAVLNAALFPLLRLQRRTLPYGPAREQPYRNFLDIEAAPTAAAQAVAVAITLAFPTSLLALHVWATQRSLHRPRAMQGDLQRVLDPVQARLLQPLTSRQRYRHQDISADPRPNGRPPRIVPTSSSSSAAFGRLRSATPSAAGSPQPSNFPLIEKDRYPTS